MRYPSVLLVVGVFVTALTGCVNLEPTPVLTRYFVLGSYETVPDSTQGVTVELGRVRLVPYLHTPNMVLRYGPYEVRYTETYRWGEDLADNIGRVLSWYLMEQPGVGHAMPGRISRLIPDFVVDVQFTRFEGHVAHRSHLAARWVIRDGETRAILFQGQTDHATENWSPGDYPDLAKRLDASLRVLAEDIAEAL